MHKLNDTTVLVVLLAIHVLLVLCEYRAFYVSTFDPAYWKDKYEHSQWGLPLSIRTIGDDGVYLYNGFRLIRGGDPTTNNAEMPPLGKYAIGLSIALFGNGYIYGFIVTLLTILAFYLLTMPFFRSRFARLGATALFALDPLVTSQFPLAMLDALQLLFLLLAVRTLAATLSASHPRRKFLFSCLTGVLLGFFSATKAPLLTPIVGALFIFALLSLPRSRIYIAVFGIGGALGYILPYWQFFSSGHSATEWLRVQKWIYAFYRTSALTPNFGSATAGLLFNRYQNLFSRAWESASQWSPTWPIATLLGLSGVLHAIQKNRHHPSQQALWITIGGLSIIFLIVFNVIPFWTRYTLLVIPFFYIGTVWLLSTVKNRTVPVVVLFALILINWMFSLSLLFPTPESVVSQFTHDWQYGFFQDMYEQTTRSTRQAVTRKSFHRFGQTITKEGEIEATTIILLPTRWSRFRSRQEIPLNIVYTTRHIGSFTQKVTIPVIRESGEWRIAWDWQYFIKGLTTDSHLDTTLFEAKRGSILANNKTRLAEDVPSFMVWVTPKAVDPSREDAMYKFLEGLFAVRVKAIAFYQRVVGNSHPDLPVAIGVIPTPLDEKTKLTLLGYPGISLTPHLGRMYQPSTIVMVGNTTNTHFVECCSLLYTTTTYDGTTGLEKEKNDILKGENGGSLVIKDLSGTVTRTLLTKQKKEGIDVQL